MTCYTVFLLDSLHTTRYTVFISNEHDTMKYQINLYSADGTGGESLVIGNKYSGQHVHLISIGGGTSSTLELPLHAIKKYGRDNVQMFICALAGESRDLWRMVDWIEKRTGIHVYRVAWQPHKRAVYNGLDANYEIDGPTWRYRDIWDVFEHVNLLPTGGKDPCSRVLKRDLARRFIFDLFEPANTTLHVGITSDEIDRMMAIRRRYKGTGLKVRADLADLDLAGSSAERAREILGWTPFVYKWGGSHNNCGGFCIKAGHAHMARLLYHDRETYLYHESREREFRAERGLTQTIMRDRKTIDGKQVSFPLTLEAFRLRMEARWADQMFAPFDDLEETPACVWCGSVA